MSNCRSHMWVMRYMSDVMSNYRSHRWDTKVHVRCVTTGRNRSGYFVMNGEHHG